MLAVSDGVEARLGTLTAGWEWFKPWRTISGEELAPVFLTELQVAIEGAFEKRRFLSLLRDFIVFEDDGGGRLAKKMAGYHQFHAVETAVGETLRAAELQRATGIGEEPGRYESGRKPGGKTGDRRIGVVWHTQGSGKSPTMAFYAGRIIREPAMANPTVVVLTDRNDLDDQLFGTFARCRDLLRQPPVQAIARVNRVFRDKPGGLVVDSLGLAQELKRALATYTESGGTGRTALDQGEAVTIMLEKYEICCALFHGFGRSAWVTGALQERLSLLPAAQEHVLAQENGKDRCIQAVRDLSRAFALAVPHEDAIRIRDEVAFFQAVQAVLVKRAAAVARPDEELD